MAKIIVLDSSDLSSMPEELNELFIKRLEGQGRIITPAIANAFRAVDRANFVPPDFRDSAYVDKPIPISEGMTTSQPSTIAFMLEKLQPQLGQKILEIGTGSGYLTALLAKLVGLEGRVFSIEYFPELNKFAGQNLEKYKLDNVKLSVGDGKKGLPEEALFDIIVSSAEVRRIPIAWKKQLKIGGRLLTPFDGKMIMLTKIFEKKFKKETLPFFSFVKLK